MQEALSYFNGDSLPSDIFISKYALRDKENNILEKNPDEMHWRLAKEIARIEKNKFKKPFSAKAIHNLFKDFQYLIPQGSIMFGIGNPYSYVTLSNCFCAGTRVFTLSGIKNIEDVQIGDETIAHDGSTKKVVQLHKNKLNNRKIFRVKCFRTPYFNATDNHKFLSISKEQLEYGCQTPQWNTLDYLRKGDYIAIPKRVDFEYTNTTIDISKFVENQYTINGDILLPYTQHNPINRYWKIDKDFAYFLGLWYGDGCVFSDKTTHGLRNKNIIAETIKNKTRGITFTFSAKEDKIVNFVIDYGQKLLGVKADINNNTEIDGSIQIVFHSSSIGQIFENLFGRRCNGKRLYTEMYKWNKELIYSLTQGLIDSDGSITKDGDLRVVLNNTKLIEEFYHLLRTWGMPVGVTYGVGVQKYARLTFPKYSRFIQNSNKFYNDNRIQQLFNKKEDITHLLELDNYTLVRIDEKVINNIDTEYVFTLGIEETHSYTVEGLISLNCYVLTSPYDSYAGIHYTDEQITQISKRRGGVGFDISNIRPIGLPTQNSSRSTTGIIPFMERFSNSVREVGQNNRRGASLQSISVHHPQIIDFIRVKQDKTKITGSNLSVRLTNEFLDSVEKSSKYQLRWPVDNKENPVVNDLVDSSNVWNEIIQCAHSSAEPCVLFWDNIIKESPADCYSDMGFATISTNPCAELPLSLLDSCRLLLLNLFSFVENPFTSDAKFNFDKLHKYARYAQRIIDDIIDLELECVQRIINKINADPEPWEIKARELLMWQQVKSNCAKGRRTGVGPTAIGDAIAALNIRYGSEESKRFIDEIYRTIKLGSYRSSIDMAKELGPFPIFNYEKESSNPFLLRIKDDDPKLYADMKKYGRRNIANLTTAPAGTTSNLAGPGPFFGTTSGFEPLFMMEYLRNVKIINDDDNKTKEDFIDESGDRWRQFTVIHPKLRLWQQITGKSDIKESPYYGSCAEDIDWKERVRMQGIAQLHNDHSISSTINLPESATIDDVDIIYRTMWKSGCKGGSVYRKNCRNGVLVEKTTCKECGSSDTITKNGKCFECRSCGWSLCSV